MNRLPILGLNVGLALAAAISGTSAFADHTPHHGHGGSSGQPSPATGYAAESEAAHQQMMDEMGMLVRTGDPDTDFAREMIIHHQSAIGMANAVLKHGTDPTIRAMAQKIISDQDREISEFEAWLSATSGGNTDMKQKAK